MILDLGIVPSLWYVLFFSFYERYWKCDIKGSTTGRLVGKKIGIKDNVAVAGVPMMNGSKILEGYTPEFDATIITRILNEGTIYYFDCHLPLIVFFFYLSVRIVSLSSSKDRRGRDRIVVGYIATYAISAYHHLICVLDTTLFDTFETCDRSEVFAGCSGLLHQ